MIAHPSPSCIYLFSAFQPLLTIPKVVLCLIVYIPKYYDATMMDKPLHKILVVDDDRTSRRLMKKFLDAEGYTVTKAKNGAQALEMLANEQFDLLITDVTMPRIGGLGLLEKMRGRYDIPAIVVTEIDIDSETQRRSYSLGASKFMVKPLDRDDLLFVVREILEKDKR